MAAKFPTNIQQLNINAGQINVGQVNVTLNKLEQNVKIYGGGVGKKIDKIGKDIQSIRDHVDQQKLASKTAGTNDKIKKIGNVAIKTLNAFDDITSNDPCRMIKGSVEIVESILSVVGGTLGAVGGAICGILGAILSLFSRKKPEDLATKFANMVHVELQKFHKKLQDEKLAGLAHRVANMNRALGSLSEYATSSDHTEIPDSILYTRDLPQIIGEIANNISRGLNRNSKKEDKEDCVRSMVVYCQAKNILLLLLANILATFKSIGRNTRQIEDLIKSEMEDCHAVLGFLSNVGPICYLPNGGGQVFKIVELRENIESYQTVDAFREKLGMSRMGDLKSIRALSYAASVRPFLTHIIPIADTYPQPQMKDNHYFQFINHTDYPVKVECGTAGSKVNGLEFRQDVLPRTSYEHIASVHGFKFSTAGYFIIYLDGEMKSYEDRFNGKIKVFEMALLNRANRNRKGNILEKEHTVKVDGEECWKEMNDYDFGKNTTYFTHGNQNFVVFAALTDGENDCHTWRFVVQQFDLRTEVIPFITDDYPQPQIRGYPLHSSADDIISNFRSNYGIYFDCILSSIVKDGHYTGGDNRYLQFINHTNYPVKVVCGTAGSKVNGLEFRQDVLPRTSYEHIASVDGFQFSTAGYFIIYLDGEMKSYEDRFNGKIKVFEMALLNGADRYRKGNILLKEDTHKVDGNDCWNIIGSKLARNATHFSHGNEEFAVFAALADGENDYCHTWRFVVQQYDPLTVTFEQLRQFCVKDFM